MRIVTELDLAGDGPVHRIDGPGLCDLLGISPAMLTELKRRGIAKHLGRDAWDLAVTVQGYCAHLRGTASGRGDEAAVLNLTGERARLARLQADAQDLKNAALRRELVPAVEVAREWGEALRAIRARVLAIPSRVRSALPHLTPADVAALDRETRAALDDLADNAGADDAA
ncbi:phage terminase Nu1 subunit (DNA packaging protein) [Paracoccus pantotrophus]|uniref:DNA packaging protein n=1 Tax=Paracoccus pantotrophus TaxID=82367 RepID=A0AAE6NVT2_PARPN|nr:DNA packaging protein [Paracoccus pantotrophus]QFG37294.1 DNA packaging protein [Paracoccus pantotrophus]RKS52274.1 phage terminase Nu1 subunit (DNA packaging protein) [Paracoccus pantotrophus]